MKMRLREKSLFADEQDGLHESVRDQRRGDALRRQRLLSTHTGDERLQVRV